MKFVEHYLAAKDALENPPTPPITEPVPDGPKLWEPPTRAPGPDLAKIDILRKMIDPAQALQLGRDWLEKGEMDSYDHGLALEELEREHGQKIMRRARVDADYGSAEKHYFAAVDQLYGERQEAYEIWDKAMTEVEEGEEV